MRGLNKLYWLKIDIKDIEEEIEEINREINYLPIISSPSMSGMPHGTDISSPTEKYCLKKEALEEKLKQRREKLDDKKLKLLEEKERLEGIIERIDDDRIRKMAEMRFIKCKSWEDIAEEVNYERSWCFRKLKNYIDNMEI